MNEQERNLLELFAQRIEARSDRAWAEGLDGAGITLPQARENVSRVLRSQLADRHSNSNAPGMRIVIGILSLEEVFPSFPPSEAEVTDAIERSITDYCTFQVLRVLARFGYPEQFPALKTWECDLVSGLAIEPPQPKGPSIFRDAQRNMLIVSQIRQLRMAGFQPTRNDATSEHTSGCDIVAEVLTELDQPMSYPGVEAVWKKREKVPKPKYQADLLADALLKMLRDLGEDTSDK